MGYQLNSWSKVTETGFLSMQWVAIGYCLCSRWKSSENIWEVKCLYGDGSFNVSDDGRKNLVVAITITMICRKMSLMSNDRYRSGRSFDFVDFAASTNGRDRWTVKYITPNVAVRGTSFSSNDKSWTSQYRYKLIWTSGSSSDAQTNLMNFEIRSQIDIVDLAAPKEWR